MSGAAIFTDQARVFQRAQCRFVCQFYGVFGCRRYVGHNRPITGMTSVLDHQPHQIMAPDPQIERLVYEEEPVMPGTQIEHRQ